MTRMLYKGIGSAVIIAAVLDFALTLHLGLPIGYFVAVLSGLALAIAPVLGS